MKNDFISGIIAYHISRFEGRSTNFKSRKECFNSEFIVFVIVVSHNTRLVYNRYRKFKRFGNTIGIFYRKQ